MKHEIYFMKKSVFLFIITFIVFSTSIQAQEYQKAVGIKISSGIAASYKNFVKGNNALELQAMYFNEGFRSVALYEFHFTNIEGLPGITWYVGPGVHAGFWNKTFSARYNSTLDVGFDGVIGFDYKFKNSPINISIDWQPAVSIVGKSGLQPQFGGIGLRYVIQ